MTKQWSLIASTYWGFGVGVLFGLIHLSLNQSRARITEAILLAILTPAVFVLIAVVRNWLSNYMKSRIATAVIAIISGCVFAVIAVIILAGSGSLIVGLLYSLTE